MRAIFQPVVAAIAIATVILAGSSPSLADTVTLYPNLSGWDPSGSQLDYVGASSALEACRTNDGDTSYLFTTDNGYKSGFFNLDDTSLTGTINSVTVYILARGTTSSSGYKIGIRSGETYYPSDGAANSLPVTTNYVEYSYTWLVNPGTLDAWTWSEINALQAGVALRKGGRCTLIWVVVDYTSGELSDETAFAYGAQYANSFLESPVSGLVNSNRWGWTNGPLGPGSYTFELWAAAGQNEFSNGTLVGTVDVEYDGSVAIVTYNVDAGFTLDATHLYVGSGILPMTKQGAWTVAPGQYPYGGDSSFTVVGLSGTIYVIAQAEVLGDF